MALTLKQLNTMKPGDVIYDGEFRGFRARCLPSGVVRYEYRYRRADGTRPVVGVGLFTEVSLDAARRAAQAEAGKLLNGTDPKADRAARKAPSSATPVAAVVKSFLDEYVASNIARPNEYAGTLNRFIVPALGKVDVYELKRSAVLAVLKVIKNGGVLGGQKIKAVPVQANRTLAHFRKCLNWFAVENDNFKSPLVAGMKPHKERRRERVLDNDEIRDIVQAADELVAAREVPPFLGDYVRVLFLTAQRSGEAVKVAHAREFDGDDWHTKIKDTKAGQRRDHLVPLTSELKTLFGVPGREGYLFTTTGGTAPFQAHSQLKEKLDERIAANRKAQRRAPMPHWRWHDVRRTSRSRLSKYAKQIGGPDIPERIIGHKISELDQVYNKHSYREEKLAGLVCLSKEYRDVFPPRPGRDNVVPLRRSSSRAA